MRRFTALAEAVLKSAKQTSISLCCPFTGSEHVLLSMLTVCDCIAYKLLTARGMTEVSVKKLMPGALLNTSRVDDGAGLSVRLRHILDNASEQASRHGSSETGTEHILLAIISEDECTAARIITDHGIKLSEIFSDVTAVIGCRSAQRGKRREKDSGYLSQYGSDLCSMYENNRLFPCIGRNEECDRVIRILCRKTKNNPCLLGEAGVGKTAVAEGIAALISDGKVPEALIGKTVISIDIASVLAGAKYRGDFEERFRGIIKEAAERKDVILFIDELHMLVGAGAASDGAVDAANILKQPLGRGDISVIGATTFSEYEKYIESDTALCRRFQPVMISEPDDEQTYTILCGIRPVFEDHHGVIITDEALKAAVVLSRRYIKNRYLPDKAIDLIDEAASANVRPYTVQNKRTVINEDDIKRSLYKITGKYDCEKNFDFSDLQKKLNERVFGQSKAVFQICSALMRRSAGLCVQRGPRASFLFKGAVGTGKSEMCRALSDFLSNGRPFIRFDMNEYTDPHTVSSLIGSPPGYVGYGEGGLLTSGVRKNPYSVVCFDNADKAHPDINSLLLQILEYGSLSDSRGRITDFSGTIIIFTVSSDISNHVISGFSGDDRQYSLPYLSSSLLERIDKTVEFDNLDDLSLIKIIERRMNDIKSKCKEKLSYSDQVCRTLLQKCDRHTGGHGALKAVVEYIEEPVSYLLLDGDVCGINVYTDGKDIKITGIKSIDKTKVLEYN